ncbi:peptidoglycan-binding protein [Streptomyces sp. NPDC088387]|uniref:peptidoglycan-binding domain-containing protein n=1 Tax=Streptomyces sp. NPDC088387 TaxID=3365859 RepID=UPI003817D325
MLIAVAAGVAAILTAGGVAGGLFSYDKPSRDSALPEDLRAAVPDVRTSASEESRGTEPTSPASTPIAPPPATAGTPTPSPTPTRSEPASASSPPSGTPTPTPTVTSSTPSGPEKGSQVAEPPPVLRPGDSGPEVVELQLRLTELNLYIEDPDGEYDRSLETAVRTYQWARGVKPEELGVYDGRTRDRLEGETAEP